MTPTRQQKLDLIKRLRPDEYDSGDDDHDLDEIVDDLCEALDIDFED